MGKNQPVGRKILLRPAKVGFALDIWNQKRQQKNMNIWNISKNHTRTSRTLQKKAKSQWTKAPAAWADLHGTACRLDASILTFHTTFP